jgi:single-stranded-DNA-specific exonuclease
MKKHFKPANEKILVRSYDENILKQIKNEIKEIKITPTIAKIIASRGIKTKEDFDAFFSPKISCFNNPFFFSDMEKACERIKKAIINKEKIFIYGDYDVDGITATATLLRFLDSLSADCSYYLPNRLLQGYGLSIDGIKAIAQSGAKLIITVDCGITSIQEIQLANSLGIDVIVTDHHEPKEKLPEAYAILNPKLPACKYPDDSLAGVGVALKLIQALAKYLGAKNELWEKYLDLVAVGTAADIVPLIGENRIIAAIGFKKLASTKNEGLKSLLSIQGCLGEEITTRDIVFRLAPCINAVGRLGDSRRGVELFLTDDSAIAALYAKELKQANVERRALDNSIQQEAFLWVEQNCDPDKDYVIVSGSKNWHCGVIGIAASKIVEKYHRPAILFAVQNDGIARGSGRSIDSFHLHDALCKCSFLLEEFGGHSAAAGMTIKENNIDLFRKKLNEIAYNTLTKDDFIPKIIADAEVSLNELTYDFFSFIRKMEPFGPGNMRPVFVCKNLRNKFTPKVYADKHVKLVVTDDNMCYMDAIAFNYGERKNELEQSNTFKIAFTLEENEWQGKKNLQLKVKGVETC